MEILLFSEESPMDKPSREDEQTPLDQEKGARAGESRDDREHQERRKTARRSRDFDPTSRGDENGEVR